MFISLSCSLRCAISPEMVVDMPSSKLLDDDDDEVLECMGYKSYHHTAPLRDIMGWSQSYHDGVLSDSRPAHSSHQVAGGSQGSLSSNQAAAQVYDVMCGITTLSMTEVLLLLLL